MEVSAEKGAAAAIADALKDGDELLPRRFEAMPIDRWISVEERIPDENQKVIASNGHWVDSCRMFAGAWYFYPNGDDQLNVTHWMPYPNAPIPVERSGE